MAAVALPSTPALAQEAASTPPPVAATLPPVVQPAPEIVTPPAPSVPEPAPAPAAAAPAPAAAAPAPVAPPVAAPAPVAEAPAAAVPAETRRTAERPRRAATQPARTVQRAPTAPVATAPAATAVPVTPPVTEPAPEAPVADAPQPPTAEAPVAAATTTTQTTRSMPWDWIAAGVVGVIALIGLVLFARRRRSVDYYEDDLAYAPVVASEPAFAGQPSPVVAVDEERPWIGLSINPLRAGSDGNEAVVDYELRVENAGDVPATNVRVSSALVGGIGSKPIDTAPERTVDLAPGASITLKAHLTNPARLGVSKDFLPMILAEARYPLPNGGEGHIAARFAIGIMDGDHVAPIALEGGTPREDVAAELDGVLERV